MRVLTAVTEGTESTIAAVECSLCKGFSGLKLIGNTTEVVRDGRERARAAVEFLGVPMPAQTMLVNIAPAEVKKDGSQLDLPMAVAIALAAGATVSAEGGIDLGKWMFVGELGLQGELRPVRGVVPFALEALARGLTGIVMSSRNLQAVEALMAIEGRGVEKLKVMAFDSLNQVLAWLAGERPSEPDPRMPRGERRGARAGSGVGQSGAPDFDDMILLPEMERVALAATTGMHSLLLRGSPGCGKSMFASRLPSIMPPMVGQLRLESLRIHSTFQAELPTSLVDGIPPFRAPHHQASASALLGSQDRPGEMALAHGGILFLDELPEYRRDLLESLREPLETGEVRVSRARCKVTWKARLLLVAACNNCPCGWFGSAMRVCVCPSTKRLAYQARLSGPLLQRVDMHVNVPERPGDNGSLFVQLGRVGQGSPTRELRARVQRAREFAAETWKGAGAGSGAGQGFNGTLQGRQILLASGVSEEKLRRLINHTLPKGVSPRTVLRCLRVARTLADLDSSRTIGETQMSEAYRWLPEPSAGARGEDTPVVREVRGSVSDRL